MRYPVAVAIAGWGVMVLGLCYLGFKALGPDVADVDLKYLWLAGLLWGEGVNAYGPDYATRAAEIFVDTNVPGSMLYPPYWYPWARLIALFPVEMAERIWGAASGVMILSGAGLMIAAFRSAGTRELLWPIVAFVVFLAAGSTTAQALAIGQTTPVLLLGVGFFFHALATGSRVGMCLALLLLMLKPHVGLPFAILALGCSGLRSAVLAAAALSVVASLPALLPFGAMDVLRDYVAVLGAHGTLEVNFPPSLTGIVNLAHNWFGVTVDTTVAAGLAALVAALLAVGLFRRGGAEQAQRAYAVRAGLLLVASTVFLVPLHTYDIFLIAPVLLLPLVMKPGKAVLLGLGVCCAVLFRPNNVAGLAGLVLEGEGHSPGSWLASLALAGLMVVVAVAVATECRRFGAGLPVGSGSRS